MLLRAASVVRTPPRWLWLTAWVLVLLGLLVAQVLTFRQRAELGTDWRAPRELIDFRDAAWFPTRYLLQGENPYDAPVYTAAHPGAQELNLYAPVWLGLAVPFALLPWSAAAAAYLVVGAVMLVVFVVALFRLAAPRYSALGEPLLLAWCLLWGPTRYALQNGGTLLVMLGVVMVVRAVCCVPASPVGVRVVPGERSWQALRLRSGELAAIGTALSLIKPQFGLLFVVVLLAIGWWRSVLGAAAVLTAVSLPALLACVVAAGGVGAFALSLQRNLIFASSPDSPTGLASPINQRIDVLGLLARYGLVHQPGWLSLAVPILMCLIAVLVTRSSISPVLKAVALITAMLAATVHQPYDIVPLLLVAVAGAPILLELRPTTPWVQWPITRVVIVGWVLACLPVLHLQSLTLAAGVPRLAGDTFNVVVLGAALAVALLASVGAHRHREESPSERFTPPQPAVVAHRPTELRP